MRSLSCGRLMFRLFGNCRGYQQDGGGFNLVEDDVGDLEAEGS